MKKLLALLLAVTIVMTMSIPAFAEEVDETVDDHSGSATVTDEEPSAEIGVYGNYLDKLDAKKILSVVVSWTDMHFKYAKSQQGTWNPESHTYEDPVDVGEWLNNSATITIANHSNTAVTASLSYTQIVSTANGTLSQSSVELDTAENTEVSNPPSDTVNFTIDGYIGDFSIDSGVGDDGKVNLGTIHVNLTANETEASVLDLSGKELSEWAALVAEYLDEHPGELTVKLGTDNIDYVGDEYGQVDSDNMPAHVLNDAIYDYNGGNYTTKVALTLVDVKEIGDKAFIYAAAGFSSISAPNATEIGEQAFQGNSSLKTFNFPKVTTIGSGAFNYCANIESITFGTVITTVRSSPFGNGSSDWIGEDPTTSNITLTLNAGQSSNADYPATFGENGTWAGYTWKNVQAR